VNHLVLILKKQGPLLQFTSVLGQVDVNDPVARDTPSQDIVNTACANLRKDFRVGISEEMDRFVYHVNQFHVCLQALFMVMSLAIIVYSQNTRQLTYTCGSLVVLSLCGY
jgi:hypothetical protein